MDHNDQPPLPSPPPQAHHLRIYNYDLPDESYPDMTVPSSHPVSISISNSIALYFTITNNFITISTPDNENNEPSQFQVHDLSYVNEVQNFYPLHLPLHLHGLTIPNLPTLPAFIKITINDGTFDLLVTTQTTIFLIDPSLPFTRHGGNGNHEPVNRSIRLPFTLTLLFNNDNNPHTIIAVTFVIGNDSIYIMAYSQPGITEWAAVLDLTPEADPDA
ncbi:hypothetical protein Lal_00003536 [Lupinus albus]|nr:hypothetical protein Lal_00003536 [Lupinus albus]